jgi:hypothetical protein
MPKKCAKPNRKKRKHLTNRQETFVKALAEGKSLTEATKTANYSGKNPGQSGYQALAQLRGRVLELLERHGLGEEVLIEKSLKPLLEAEETKFFNDGKKQINVEALAIRHASCRTAFELHGSYAPGDPKEAAHYGVRVIRVDIPRPLIDVIPEAALSRHGVKPFSTPANGKPPEDKNGHD